MDQRDSHCPYSLSSELTAKPTVLGLLVCNYFCYVTRIIFFFDIGFNFILQTHVVQQRGKKTLLSLTLICYCHLVAKVQIVRGSTLLYDHETPLLVDLADLLYYLGIAFLQCC